MNISIYKIHKVFSYLVFLLLPLWGGAQSIEHHTVLKNDILELNYHDCIFHPLQIEELPINGSFLINGAPLSPVYGNNLILSYIPNLDFSGLDTMTVISNNQESGGAPGPVTKILVIEVVDYMVEAVNDFALTNTDVAINIAVLDNDHGSGSLTIESIPMQDYGIATILADNTIDFTPASGFSGVAQFHYTSCVDTAQCDRAIVTVFVEPVGVNHDTINLATKKNVAKNLLIQQVNGFEILDAPVNGSLISLNDGMLRYTPNSYFSGQEIFRCAYNTNTNPSVRTFVIDVLDTSNPTTFANDDYAFVSIDGVVDIPVLDNDDGFNLNFGAINESPEHGTYSVEITTGIITYEPDLGFVGVDRIKYTSCTPSYQCEKAYVYIFVGNMYPSPTSYTLSTPINTPMIVNYGIPINDWEFILNNANSTNGGTVVYEPNYYTGTINGQEVEGFNLLIYTPPADFTGTDDFSFQYCVDTDCKTVDIVVEVTASPNVNITNFCIDECVWSGDANSDGLANIKDLLPIGYCMGETGFARPDGEVKWYGQFGDEWDNSISQSGINLKHVDTDGNGTVEVDDTLALSAFFGDYHNLTPEESAPVSSVPLYFVTRTENPGPGDFVEVDVFLGVAPDPALDVSGFSFGLDYNTTTVEEGSFHLNFTNDNWLAYASPMLSMTNENTIGHLDAGYTRTDGQVASGHGRVAVVDFIIEDNIDGVRLKDSLQMRIQVSTPTAMTAGGMYSRLTTQDHWVTIYLDQDEERDLSDEDLITYPNPAQDQINLHLNGRNAFRKVSLYSIVGHPIATFEVDGKQTSVDVSGLINGVYVLQVVTDRGFISKKIEVMREN